jgi:thiamine-monophosphate kinase
MKSEFEFLKDLQSKYHLRHIGDDCAVLPMSDTHDLLVTADMLVEDVDFRLDWTTPEFLGHKSLAVSLSDIAAMGGTPKWALVSVAIPESLWKTDFLDRFYAGWHDLARMHGVELVGGDISRADGALVVDSVVGGEVDKGSATRRNCARAGDAIFVTGFLGAAAAGLSLLESGERFDPNASPVTRHLLLRQLQPLPQIQTANILYKYDLATSMIDISDGLSSDLTHILHASGVGAGLVCEDIPIDPATAGFPQGEPLKMALHGGEDYELLFTVEQKNILRAKDLGFHHIGEITANVDIIELTHDDVSTILGPKGYRHF